MGEPIVPGDSEIETKPKAVEGAAEATLAAPETSSGTPAREPAPRSNKRNSIFGSLFGKKEAATSPTSATNEAPPLAPAKDSEPAAVSATAPQLSDPVKDIAPATETAAAAPVSEPAVPETAPATTSTTSPVSPETTKANRRSSFFSNLGTKKEKKINTTSDTEVTDGEGKKSGGFSGLLRKASRAQGARPSKATAPTTGAATEAEAPAPADKETAATEPTTNGETATEPSAGAVAETAPETTTAAPQQTPVQATA